MTLATSSLARHKLCLSSLLAAVLLLFACGPNPRVTGSGGASGGGAGPIPEPQFGTGYDPCPTNGQPCKILPLGDSITYGIGFSGGYRVELFSSAVAAGKKITFTGSVLNGPTTVAGQPFPRNNEGHSGWRISQLMPLLPNPAMRDLPHIVLLHIGTNDITLSDNLPAAPQRLGALIDRLIELAPQALIVVAKITPTGFGSPGTTNYNNAIPAVVQQRVGQGKHVMLVDMFTGFPTSMLGDGVHPNQAGYGRMASVWYKAIGPVLH
jgi:lysophospholipase L1-like esterase